mmetsp:Transcript_41217/g.62717  ORF Transcript_41217/g.62717 Transcript_41217/m.62717 type:complete len:135 (+) Transcript_41217:517-921(+)
MDSPDNEGGESHQVIELGGQVSHEQVCPENRDGSSMATRNFRINDLASKAQQEFLSNYIRTTKYTAFSFLPVGLFNLFKRFQNFYFLMITIMQCIPAISPWSPWTAINPTVVVIAMQMSREGYEDYQRYKSDLA